MQIFNIKNDYLKGVEEPESNWVFIEILCAIFLRLQNE